MFKATRTCSQATHKFSTRSAAFPARCFHALRRQTEKGCGNGLRFDIVIFIIIVVVSSSGKVFRQWAGCGSDNGWTLVAASAVVLVDSPVVELFAVSEFVGLLLGILLFLKDVFLCLSLGLRVSLRPIPCERSSKRRPFQSQCA